MQVWLLTVLSMAAISCATMLLVRAEDRLYGRAGKNYFSKTILWVVEALTQESEAATFVFP